MEDLEEKLKRIATQKASWDDEGFMIEEWADSVDNAFNHGMNNGEIIFARELLQEYYPTTWADVELVLEGKQQ